MPKKRCFAPVPAVIEFIKAGKLRAIAVTSTTWMDAFPGVPAVAEYVPGFEAIVWHGLAAPKNTPSEIIEKLNSTVNAALADSKIKEQLALLGGVGLGGSPADFGTFVARETDKWAKVVRAANIKAD